MKWVRHRRQPAPGSTEAMASVRPWWASLITRDTPVSLRATRPRKNAFHQAPSSVVITSRPSTSRCPSPLTPTATTQATLTIRPASTRWVRVSGNT